MSVIIEVNSVQEFEEALNKNTLMPFQKVVQKFNELLFEIQIEDNKKIIEFQNKLKELRAKIELELKGDNNDIR